MIKTLKIRAYPRTGIISDQYLPLDGILYFNFVRSIMGEQLITRPNESIEIEKANFFLPFQIHGDVNDPDWFYCCSFAQWSNDVVEDQTFKIKRNDFIEFQRFLNDHKKFSIARGKYKNYLIKIYYRHCSYIDWYCVGDPIAIAKLLRFCTHIGKNTGDGWGEVMRWEIMDWPHDWSIFNSEGKLMRAISASDSNYQYGLRPSYWDQKHIMPCQLPE